ncbi:hypothetical protein B0H13DRAFT_1624374, partial [Mycena leptocephala]
LAGFKGAIGTMWSMRDADGPLLTENVYAALKGQHPLASNDAKALQRAARKMREAGVPFPRRVPFIHMGI